MGQLNIHYQNLASGFASSPDWTGSIDTRGEIRLVDMDADNRLDLLRIAGEGNDRNAYFYRNQDGSFNLDQANQVMRFSGYDISLNIISVSANSSPLLNVSFYTIPVVDAIRNASITRSQMLFGSNSVEANQFFNRRADSKLDESFSASNVRGLAQQMSLQYDIDGDGRKDAIYITENCTLAAKRISNNLVIENEPFWEYVSSRSVFEFEVLALNQDQKPDILLRHGTATTILVAAP